MIAPEDGQGGEQAVEVRVAALEVALAERARKGEARQLLMDVILPVLADPSVPDELVGGRLPPR